mgnify:CR=1 FL=1
MTLQDLYNRLQWPHQPSGDSEYNMRVALLYGALYDPVEHRRFAIGVLHDSGVWSQVVDILKAEGLVLEAPQMQPEPAPQDQPPSESPAQ